MNKMYEKYGYYKEKQISVTLKGQEGAEKIKLMMENMRNNPPTELAGLKVISVGDYSKQVIHNNLNGENTSTNLPKSNVLYYELENDSWCCVRPSGTEPKIKFYLGVKGINSNEAEIKLDELSKEVNKYTN